VSFRDALLSKKYRRSSWNTVVLAWLHQFCGNSVVMLFSTKIFLFMELQGQLTIPVYLANILLYLSAVLVSFFASVPQQYFGQRKTLLFGQSMMVLSLTCTTIFSLLDIGVGVLISMIALACTFQLTLAPIYFIHASETCVDAAIGFGSQNLYIAMLVSMVISSKIIDSFGNAYVFLLFGVISFLGYLYMYFCVRDTTFGHRIEDIFADD
jgi:MFS transporter, SP family, arabinose:H+ symporter